jgi:hypothetical protein
MQKLNITLINFYKQFNSFGYDKIIPTILARSARQPATPKPPNTQNPKRKTPGGV